MTETTGKFKFLLDNNVITRILKGDAAVTDSVAQITAAIDAVVYIEALQGSVSNEQKANYQEFG